MRYAMVALVLALSACSSVDLIAPPGLDRPEPATPFDPPPAYAERYRAMEECVGITGDFGRVRWYTVPGESWPNVMDGRQIAGQWWPPHDIYLAEAVTGNMGAVDHEILHDILRTGDHPAPPFGVCAPTRL